MSSALQLVGLEWSQGFYMPKVQGLIPLEGNIKTCVDCVSSVRIYQLLIFFIVLLFSVRLFSSLIIPDKYAKHKF